MNRNCEDGCGIDDAMELPTPARTITNHRIEGVLEIENAFREDAHDFVSGLVPEPQDAEVIKLRDDIIHGAIFGDERWCVPCGARYDMHHNPTECPQCGAPWDRPVTDAAA